MHLFAALLLLSACGTSKDLGVSRLQDNNGGGSISLKANDGTRIDVGYWISREYVGEGLGSTYVEGVNGLAVHLSDVGRDAAVVITVNDAYSISCSKDADGWFHVSRNCRFGARGPYEERWFQDSFWELYRLRTGHGLYEVNRFHLSVVRDGVWLTEDITNGTHNFALNF